MLHLTDGEQSVVTTFTGTSLFRWSRECLWLTVMGGDGVFWRGSVGQGLC